MKFGTQMQNVMLVTTHRSKSKPEVEFQYHESSDNLVVDWDISSTFSGQIDLDIPEVNFRLYGRHLK